ncbi:MAG: neutral/alkaline non-lysosomal ceramidase N-terminal domain-containing protein [Alcanivoracaceae bacterium]
MARPKKRLWRKPAVVVLLGLILLGLGVALYIESRPFVSYPVTELRGTLPMAQILPAPATAMAGMAVVDITPPIGLPKFGYSAWAQDADGFRTRLKARAFYLRGPAGEPMALVQLDLGAGSLVLHHRVAERIAAETDIPPHALTMLVTHTHTGPANFLDSDFYNVFGANRPGFDPAVADFLVDRISEAVMAAFAERRPARVAIGQREVWGMTRNRSVQAWANNFNIAAAEINEALAFRAVNPVMTMLRIDLQHDDGAFYPAGALTSFSIHGTSIPAFTGPYHADVWAWLARDVEAAMVRSGTPFVPVHGPFQATHADNNPAWHLGERGDLASRRIGKGLANEATRLWRSLGGQLDDQLVLQSGSRLVNVLTLNEDARFGLCERAVVGAATAGAANGDEVFPIAWLPYLQEGWPRRVFTDGCHGVKQWMLSKLQLLLPADRYPHRALLQVFRINELVLVTAPWEITLESGNHLRDTVAAALPEGDWRIEVSSLGNGMFGYVTTPAEYALQYYEGGHTIYGPQTLDFLAGQFAALSADLVRDGEVRDLPDSFHFRLASRQFWPQAGRWNGERQITAAAEFVRGELPGEPHWRLQVRAEPPGNLVLHKPLLHIEDDRGEIVTSDQGTDLQLRLIRDDGSSALYEVRWFYPPISQSRRHRLHLAGRDGIPALVSDWF